jgi:hypothetical protein
VLEDTVEEQVQDTHKLDLTVTLHSSIHTLLELQAVEVAVTNMLVEQHLQVEML